MKKTISLLLSLILVIGLFPAFAEKHDAVTPDEAGRILKGYGALKGGTDGNLMTEQNLKRQDAIVILTRLMGKEDEAAVTSFLPSFKDITAKYYLPYIAFAQQKGWTEGRSREVFGFDDLVTTEEFAAMLLRALGYEYMGAEFSKVMSKAEELNLMLGLKLSPKGSMIRGNAFVMMYNTLETETAGGKEKLVYVLNYKKKEEVKPANLEYMSGTSVGLKAIELSFSKPISDYLLNKVELFDGKKAVNISDLRLNENGDKLMIILEKAAIQDKVYTLNLNKIMSKDMSESIEKKDIRIEMTDVMPPTVAEVSAQNPKVLMLKFSEPINQASTSSFSNTSNILIDGRSVSVKYENSGANQLVVELHSELKTGMHKIEISGFRDFAGFSVKPAQFDLEVKKDTDAPVLESAVMIGVDKLKLRFNETLRDKGDFRVNDSTLYKSNSVLDSNDKRIVYLNLAKPVTNQLIIISYKNQRDVVGNYVRDYKNYELRVQDDTDRPQVLHLDVDKTKLVIKFNEAMAKNAGTVTIKQDGSTKRRINSFASSDWVDDATLSLDISNLSGDSSKPFTVELQGFKDASIRKNEMDKYESSFRSTDLVRPTANAAYSIVEYFGTSKTQFREVKITFSEEMNTQSIEDPKNYTFKTYSEGGTVKTLRGDQADVSFTAISGSKELLIRVNNEKDSIRGEIELTGQKDMADNYISTKSVSHYTGGSNTVKNAVVKGAADDISIEVEFANPIDIINNGAFVLKDSDGKTLKLNLQENSGTKAVFRTDGTDFTLEADGKSKTDKEVKFYVQDGTRALDVYGTAISDHSETVLKDRIAPRVEGDVEVLSKNEIAVVFSEPMKTGDFALVLKSADEGSSYNNSIKVNRSTNLNGEVKNRKIIFRTDKEMKTNNNYTLVISQARDLRENLLNDGSSLNLDFFMNK